MGAFPFLDDKVYHCKEDIDAMKKKIVSLKAEMRLELRNAEPSKDVSM